MSKLSPKMWYLLKYGLLAVIVAGIFVSVLPASKPGDDTDILDLLGENDTEPYFDQMVTLDTLRSDVTHCLTKFLVQEEPEVRVTKEVTNLKDDLSSVGIKDTQYDSTAFSVLTSFNNLLSLFKVKAVIIEPSVLHCMLLSPYQELLLKKYVNVFESSKSKNILTYGIMDEDVTLLQEEEKIYRFQKIDFQPYFVQVPLTDWMLAETSRFKFQTFTSHIFFTHKLFTIHIVVFHRRKGYYWHANLTSETIHRIPSKDKLLFVDHDGAHEKFAFVSLENKVLPVSEFYIPSNPHYFLFEMQTSRFLECKTRSANTYFSSSPKSHPGMSVKRFNRRTRIVLRELKTIFHPLLMNLWIWSGTMLGWYRDCDIIPYTTDVDFAAWASEVDDLDVIINLLHSNKHVSIATKLGVLEEALEFQLDSHSLRADIFFVYPTKNGTWYSGHSPKEGYYFKYFFPNFTICSAELLGEKVQVPCETEKVIESEYGPGWRKPVSSWSYESSSKGRGPNIYWDEKMRKKVYQVY